MKQTKNTPTKRRNQIPHPKQAEKLTLFAHVQELRRRLFFIGIAVAVCSALAFAAQETLTRWLLAPAHGQQFIFTTPGGGFDFQLKLCLFAGITTSIPVIIHQVFKYIQPLFAHPTRHFLRRAALLSTLLAVSGAAFGYFIGLPAAMHFLLTSFSSEQIKALITIQSYMNFVLLYLLGAALLFQLPLVLLMLNRIRPLSPHSLFRQQRWIILGAFVAGAIISPTPDIQNQLLLTGPVILMYETSVAIIWLRNRGNKRSRRVRALLAADDKNRSERQAKFTQARLSRQALPSASKSLPQTCADASTTSHSPLLQPKTTFNTSTPLPPKSVNPVVKDQLASHRPSQSRPIKSSARRRYLNDFNRPSYNLSSFSGYRSRV
ncbi:MAG TPA: twin-arginine translocase subunit TatC [Candidatus Saccharimonadales bacterium]